MFGKTLIKMLEKVTKIWMKSLYVDDLRLVVNLFSNLRWNKDKKEFEACENVSADNIEALTKYCAGEIKHAMESVNPDLKFEMELEADFDDNTLPTLDTRRLCFGVLVLKSKIHMFLRSAIHNTTNSWSFLIKFVKSF